MSIESVMPSSQLILLPPFPPTFSLSQHQGLFQGASSSHNITKVFLGASGSASVLPMNIQCWFPLGMTGLISLLSKGLSRVFSSTTVQKHQFFGLLVVQLSHPYMTTRKTVLTIWTFVSKVISLLFNGKGFTKSIPSPRPRAGALLAVQQVKKHQTTEKAPPGQGAAGGPSLAPLLTAQGCPEPEPRTLRSSLSISTHAP